jgi:cell division protein FtsB
MNNFQVKKKKFIHSVPFLLFLFVVLIIFVVGVFSLFSKMQLTNRNKQNAQNKLHELEERKGKLLLDIDSLTTKKGQEKLYRESYGFAMEGEGVVVIVDDQDKKTQENTNESKGFFDNFLNIFR